MNAAANPPKKKKNVTLMRYNTAIRLWSPVSNHDLIVWSAFR
jgi:hypothetical protein